MTVVLRVFVTGKVQNTGYRDWAVRTARELGVSGWVRNRKDGRIELLIAGDETATDAMTDACRTGPPMSRVETVEANPDSERVPKGFTKRFTA